MAKKKAPEKLIWDYILRPDRLGKPFREVEIIEGLGEVGQGKSKLISRTAVREALSRLVGKGVLTSVRHFGTQFVIPLESDVLRMFELRTDIELKANIAIINDARKREEVSDRVIPLVNEMKKLLKTSEREGKRGLISYEALAEFNDLDAAFHAELLRIAGYSVVVHTIERFQLLARIYCGGWLRTPDSWKQVIREHQAIIDCLVYEGKRLNEEKKVADAVSKHLNNARDNILKGGRSTTG